MRRLFLLAVWFLLAGQMFYDPGDPVICCSASTPALKTVFLASSGLSNISTQTGYIAGGLVIAATDANVRVPSAVSGIAGNLYANNSTGASSYTYSITVNGAASSVTCSGSGACSDTTHTVSVTAGDTLSVKVVGTVGNANAHIFASFTIQ